MLRVLRKLGFRILREGARHTVLERGLAIVTIPRHFGDLPTGTFHAILKQAGLSRDDYLRLR